MTEDDAKTKWCPMARLEGDCIDELGANRTKSGRIPDAACCIASDCMMWRDYPVEIRENQFPNLLVDVEIHGHCGLAGKPYGE